MTSAGPYPTPAPDPIPSDLRQALDAIDRQHVRTK